MATCIASRAASLLGLSASSPPCNSIQSTSHKYLCCYPSFTHVHTAATSNNFSPPLRATSSSAPLVSARRSFCKGGPLVCEASANGIVDEVKKKNAENAVIVYSKSWCPYCSQVKGLFRDLKIDYKVIELDELREEEEVQDALYQLTRQTTVPNVFIGGKHIGGCDDTMALNRSGKLFQLLNDAGVKTTSK